MSHLPAQVLRKTLPTCKTCHKQLREVTFGKKLELPGSAILASCLNIEHVRYIQIVSMSRLSQTRTIVPFQIIVTRGNLWFRGTIISTTRRRPSRTRGMRKPKGGSSSTGAACKCFVEQTVNLAEIQKHHLKTRGTVDADFTIGESFKIMNHTVERGGVH